MFSKPHLQFSLVSVCFVLFIKLNVCFCGLNSFVITSCVCQPTCILYSIHNCPAPHFSPFWNQPRSTHSQGLQQQYLFRLNRILNGFYKDAKSGSKEFFFLRFVSHILCNCCLSIFIYWPWCWYEAVVFAKYSIILSVSYSVNGSIFSCVSVAFDLLTQYHITTIVVPMCPFHVYRLQILQIAHYTMMPHCLYFNFLHIFLYSLRMWKTLDGGCTAMQFIKVFATKPSHKH